MSSYGEKVIFASPPPTFKGENGPRYNCNNFFSTLVSKCTVNECQEQLFLIKNVKKNQTQGVYGRERERRSADPRERVRKEGSPGGGIVLSPQRRSFTSGCGAPAAAAPAAPPHIAARTRPDSPLSAAAAPPAKPDQGESRVKHATSAHALAKLDQGESLAIHAPSRLRPCGRFVRATCVLKPRE